MMKALRDCDGRGRTYYISNIDFLDVTILFSLPRSYYEIYFLFIEYAMFK